MARAGCFCWRRSALACLGLDIAQPGSLFNRHRDSGGRANVLQGVSLVTGENRLMALQTLSPPQLRMSEPRRVSREPLSWW